MPRCIEAFERDGCFYLVQTYVTGEPLSAQVMAGVRFTEEQVVAVLDQLLGILQAIHESARGAWPVIHRDLRLSNVFWSNGQVFLIDFGLARRMGCPADQALTDPVSVRADADGPECNASGCQQSSIEESADRRYRIRRRAISPQSDLFGAGVVAVDMMVNHVPPEIRDGQKWDQLVPLSPGMIAFLRRLMGEAAVEAWPSAAEARAALHRLIRT
ncbi:serine/threonine-protein kinase [Heliophilum fasciatum]|uniref:non-specific serine/threonine protein kinase n=1 Tax=Heliophilum fasciatum TaxID=35700 RepID=A0A4R2RKI5_9FIRM|nr:serine/threonine protein kinase [Heliophilum fasciatum]TCP63613.1 serine/threonine-protein kinase [Heliophilum fasciatum]